MKFLLGFIAIIFIGLGIYTYMGKSVEKGRSLEKPSNPIVIKTAKEDKEIFVKKEVRSLSEVTTKNVLEDELVEYLSESTALLTNENEIVPGEDLSLEGIKNSDVNDDEKERMIDELANYKSLQTKSEPVISIEEVVQIIEKDFEQGLIN